MDKKPSEIIAEFIRLIELSHNKVTEATAKIEFYNGDTYNKTHQLEDCADDDLLELTRQWRDDLRTRRRYCDSKALYEGIHKYSINESNKPALKRLKALLEEQKRTEEYLSIPPAEREFKKGVKSR